jgi:hypothetical protein
MASLMIHMLVGQEYCKKHRVKNVDAFLEGNIAPDLVKDKRPTHFSNIVHNKTYTETIINKVNLPVCCDNINLDSDFHRGGFLHLLTDYVFFNKYLIDCPGYKKIEAQSMFDIQDSLYRDYYRINNWIMNMYSDIKIDMLPENTTTTGTGKMEIIRLNDLRKIVEYCSNLDLDKIYEDIKTNQSEAEFI